MSARSLLLAFLVAGCALIDGPVAIRTRAQPNTVCMAARVGGILVADPTFGLAFKNSDDDLEYVNGAVWPYGFSARRENGVILLIGPGGQVVAHEGDRMQAAGGSVGDDAVNVDCDISVLPER